MATGGATTNVQTTGKTLNLAAGNVNMRKQNINVERLRQVNRRTIIYNQRQIPNGPATDFGERRIQIGKGGNDVVYDDRARTYLPKAQSDDLTDKLSGLWAMSLDSVDELEEAKESFELRIWKLETVENPEASETLPPWDEVVSLVRKELKRARKSYDVGYLRQAKTQDILVNLDQNLASFLAWVESLGSDEHRYSLCAAFRMIFKATAHNHQLNEIVLGSLSKVANMFNDAKHYTNLCSWQRQTSFIQEKTVELSGLIIALLILLFNYAAKHMPEKQQDEINEAVRNVRLILMDVNMSAKRESKMSRYDEPVVNLEGHPALAVRVSFVNFFNSSPLPQCSMVQLLTDSANSQHSGHPPTKRRRTSTHQNGRGQESQPDFRAAELERCLGYDVTVAEAQIKEYLSPSDASPEHLRRLTTFSRTDAFQKWLIEEAVSTALLVHGNFDHLDGKSPLSYLCARLVHEYGRMENVAVLHHFCGLQTDKCSPTANAAGIISQMLGQLLSHPTICFNFDLGFVTPNALKKYKKHDLKSLCQLFLDLIHQLRHKPVIIFCLIDSISVYENKALLKDTETLLATLLELVNSQRGGRRRKSAKVVMKLLVTDAGSTKHAYKQFREEVFDMTADLDEGDEGGLQIGD